MTPKTFPVLSSEELSTIRAPVVWKEEKDTRKTSRMILLLRICIGVVCLFGYIYSNYLQSLINISWKYLLSSAIFNSVYFESWFATTCYTVIIPLYPFTFHYIKRLDKYKIDPSVTYVHQTMLGMIVQALIYLSPLMLMDTFIVKKYCGIEPEVWTEKRQTWIQITRALPLEPPTLSQLVLHLIGSVLVYDALFFFVHFAVHKHKWLYKYIHAVHHDHDAMHAHVTNQLSVGERITLILSANFALKCFNSHPLTRMVFVPTFILLLVHNHSGYDLPFGLEKIVPWNLMGGARKHYNHHIFGGSEYQPFFCYLDKLLEQRKTKKQ